MTGSTTNTKGRMIMAANSLGRPEDIPPRTLAALKAATLVVFEEDRVARQTLKAAGIHRDYLRYSEHHQTETLNQVQACVRSGGTVVYVSDQGTPTLADPGLDVLIAARVAGARVEVIPGPSAVTAALSAFPHPFSGFIYAGFLPREETDRRRAIHQYSGSELPIVLMDTPYRLDALIASCSQTLKHPWRLFVALEIGNATELYWDGTIAEVQEKAAALEEKLNFVLIAYPKER